MLTLVPHHSADLWVAGSVPNSVDTGLTGSVRYAVGEAVGPLKTANLTFGNHVVTDQVFMEVVPAEGGGTTPTGRGILGLGPTRGSFVTAPNGSSMLYRLFSAGIPHYFTLLLDRIFDPTQGYHGTITIGELVPGYEPVLDEPHLPLVESRADQHHQIHLDNDGLIGPDGLPIPITSAVANSSRPVVVLDSGFSLPQVPKSVADAIYGRFPGAEFVTIDRNVGATYILPCTTEVNVTFIFGGKRFVIHPLDMTMHPSVLGIGSVKNSKGETACIATFQPFTYSRGKNPNYDMVLGMAFRE